VLYFFIQVVANAVAALSEINEASTSGSPLIEMNAQTINKLLTALNECTEWGQVFILDSLANYSPKDDREAQRYIIDYFLKTWHRHACFTIEIMLY
jgi:vesicle coat complex subunit